MKLSLPLKVKQSTRKWWMLNLNGFRNTHYRTLNAVKKNYHRIIFELISCKRKVFKKPVKLTYEVWFKDRRRRDIGNVLTIVDKFTCDGLVDGGVLKDDSFRFIPEITFRFMGFDKENPRAELTIKELSEKEIIKLEEKLI